jgi:hypothetical protein
MQFDGRLVPARPDLAAQRLKGLVAAERYVDPVAVRVVVDRTPLRTIPAPDGAYGSELLFGERFDVYDIREGWAWGQAAQDSYVGYVAAVALAPADRMPLPSHRVSALRCFAYPGPDVKTPPLAELAMGSLISPTQFKNSYAFVPHLGWIYESCLRPLDQLPDDFVAIAEQFISTPYLWGGRTGFGIDCSGLIQSAYAACGRNIARDSDMQQALITPSDEAPGRGDLIFWRGHVGVMADRETLIHANAYHMMCVAEPLAQARARLASQGLEILARGRIFDHRPVST